jgi:hypothetical protein
MPKLALTIALLSTQLQAGKHLKAQEQKPFFFLKAQEQKP